MFLKKSIVHGTEYFTIVESKRINGQPRHITIKQIGTKEELLKLLLQEDQPTLESVGIKSAKNHAEIMAFYNITKDLNVTEIINNHIYKGSGVNVGEIITTVAINRCCDPCSKNGIREWFEQTTLDQYMNIAEGQVTVQNICTSLDYLIKDDDPSTILAIQKDLFEQIQNNYGISHKSVYYDITSTYFEGSHGSIAKLGYNRDGKRDKKQVNIGLLVTKEHCFPITHLVFEGNVTDIKTVRDMLKQVTNGFIQDKSLFIFDRGMVSEDNIREFDKEKIDFISALKKTKAVKDYFREISGVVILPDQKIIELDNSGTQFYAVDKLVEFAGKERKIVICYDKQSAIRKQLERNELIGESKTELEKYCNKVNNGNYKAIEAVSSHIRKAIKPVKAFFETTVNLQNGKVIVNYRFLEDKIREAEKLDGKTALITSLTNLTSEEVITAYFQKDSIEKAFACWKGPLEIRPIRHWKPDRVKAHIFICYLAFFLFKSFEYILKMNGIKISPVKAIKNLSKIKYITLINEKGEEFYKVVNPNPIQAQLLKVLNIPI
jgi:transposase